jgi:hypothetical protein
MNDPPANLRDLQAWMQHAITHPHGMHSAASADEIAKRIGSSQRQSAQDRLEIYHRAYFARLIEVLHEMFPVLLHALEAQTFDALALAYLEQHPPQSYTLNRLADRFVDFLQRTRPPRNSDSPDWADFMIDLARMEVAVEEVFDGPGSEQAPAFDAAFLMQIAPESASELRLPLAPSVRLLEFEFPISDYYAAVRGGESPALPAPERSWLCLYRRDYIVRRLSLSEAQFALLTALYEGDTLGAALEAALPLEPDLSHCLQAWFRDWAAARLFASA